MWNQKLVVLDPSRSKDVIDLPADGLDVSHVPAQHGRLAERRRYASQDVTLT
jgi:hypothetical protein